MKRATGTNRRRRSAVALNLALVMAAGSVVGYAVSARGYDAHKPDLNDGGVWVTDSRLSSFGRINKPIGQLDAIIYSDDRSDVDVLQQDSAVVGVNYTTRRLTVLDPTTGTPAEGREASLPRASQVQLAGGTIATLDPVKGSVWAARVAPEGVLPDLSRIDADMSPVTEAGGNAALAVTQGGTVVVASADTDTLTRIAPPSGAVQPGADLTAPTSEKLALEGLPAVTAVGDTPIVLDQETGQLTVIGGARAVVEVGSVLQQPGPDADAVLLETPTDLVSVNLTTGALTTVASVPAGSPTAPVRLGSCDFAAWSGGRGYVATRCDDGEPATLTLDHHTSDLVFRVNRGQILLNDRLSGAVWNIDETPTQIDNWEAFRNPNSDNDKSSEQQNENPGDRRPPKARNDHFGTRPGRTTVTHPLDNDSAPAGRMLAVSSVEQLTGEAAPATISPDGQTVQIQQPTNASGVSTYAYYISDGRHDVGAHARITVEVRKHGNEQPSLRQSFKADTWPVAPNGTLTLPVLTDWRDPADGDALDVVDAKVTASSGEGAAVQTTTDGRIRFTAPNSPGPVELTYGVTDGRSAPVAQQLAFTVQDPDTDDAVAAKAQPDIVTAEVGEWVTIRPLANDLPGADPLSPDARLQLAGAVTSPKGAQADTDLAQGTVTFRAPEARSYFLEYDVSYGDAPLASGRIRVDVHERERRGPVAMPDTATIYGASPSMVDALANDSDPRGGVLMVQSATATSDQLDVAVVDGRWVRISARAGELRPRTQLVRYVISNGSQSATGEIQVTQRAVPDDNAPVTEPDEVTVRAGSSLTIPVLDNDFSPSGDQLVLVSDVAGQQSGRLETLGPDGRTRNNGDAFVSGRLVRFVAPATVPTAETMTVTYVAQNSAGQTAPGTLQITVIPPAKHNQPPQAPIIEGRVVAGDTITLRLPGSGIDPDGDAVTVMGLGSAPALGRVMEIGANSIQYQAYPSSTGTDEFNYLVEDALGGRATGTIRVAVVPTGPLQPPLAVADEITVEPGREATVYPMANDFVAPGDRVNVELVDPPAGVSLVGDQGPVRISTTGLEAGRDVVVVYRLDNGVETTQSTVTVHTATPYNNPPVVFDAFGATADSAAVRVDVLKGAYDPDGPTKQLRVAEVYTDDARINGTKVTVLRSEQPRVVAFRVEDADGGATIANLYVPPTGTALPYVKPGAVIRLDPGQERKLPVSSYVVNPSGGSAILADGAELVGSPPGLVTAVGLSQASFQVSAAQGFRGPGAVMLQVSAPGYRQPVVLSVPVQVGADVPVLQCPTTPITVPRGGEVRLDITRRCHVFPSTSADQGSLSYTATWVNDVDGLDLTTAEGPEIVVAASSSARTGTQGTIEVATEGSKPGRLRIRVAPAASPTLSPITVADLRAGDSRTIDLGQYLAAMVPDPVPTIVSISPVSGTGVTAAKASGSSVRLAATGQANGSATFRVTMSDVAATDQVDRQASNLLTVKLLGHPDTPSAPFAVGSIRDQTVRLSWRPPDDNGARIDRYELRASNGKTYTCPTATCDATGLTNGTPYTFSVRAHNAVGWSEVSAKSKPASPDAKPGLVSNIHTTKLASHSIWIAWNPPSLNGKSVDQYRVFYAGKSAIVRDARFYAGGVDNNTRYTFKIQAHNAAGWGEKATSGEFQAAGDPGTPEPPTWQIRVSPTSSTAAVDLSWKAVPAGSDNPIYYSISDTSVPVSEPSCQGTLATSCTIPHVPLDGKPHWFTVEASTQIGGKVSDPSATWTANAAPMAWGAWQIQPTGQDTKAKVEFTVPDSRGKDSLVSILVDGVPTLGPQQMTGAQTKTISVGDNEGPHSVSLVLCNESGDGCANSSSQRVQTWGPLTADMLKVTPILTDAKVLDWEIKISPNGAPIDVVVRSDKRPTKSWHLTSVNKQTLYLNPRDLGFSVTEKITVSVTDRPRGRSIPDQVVSQTTDPQPAPIVKVTRGDKCDDSGANPCHPPASGDPDCTDASCGFITVQVQNFFGPVTCTITAQAEGTLGTVDLADGDTKQTQFYFGVPGRWVQADCQGPGTTSESDRLSWPN